MLDELFSKYVPVISAYLSSDVDNQCKTWLDVVKVIFEMNVDRKLKLMSELAVAFDNASRPNYFRIAASSLDFHFIDFEMNEGSLIAAGFKKNVGYLLDDEGLRISFNTARRLILSKGRPEVMESFEFIESVHQMFCRYELAMMSRGKYKTHWTLVERIGKFSKPMRLHETRVSQTPGKRDTEPTMNSQPMVFKIVTGTRASIVKYLHSVDEDTFSTERLVPIFESTIHSLKDEIDAVIQHITQTYALPYREEQLNKPDENGHEVTRLSKTKHSIKFLKNVILIDPSQDAYTKEMLVQNINDVRMKLKLGKTTHVGDRLDSDNTTSIERFISSKGKFFDDRGLIMLSPHRDDVSVIEVNESMTFESHDSFRLNTRASINSYSGSSLSTSTFRESEGSIGTLSSDMGRRMRSVTCDSTLSSFSAVVDESIDDDDDDDIDEDVDEDVDEEIDAPPAPPVKSARAMTGSINLSNRAVRRSRSASSSRSMTKGAQLHSIQAGDSEVSEDSD
jgi:hypothetical protein